MTVTLYERRQPLSMPAQCRQKCVERLPRGWCAAGRQITPSAILSRQSPDQPFKQVRPCLRRRLPFLWAKAVDKCQIAASDQPKASGGVHVARSVGSRLAMVEAKSSSKRRANAS
jgi:hypothetical protein